MARGYIIDMTRHLDRLDRSLGELQIAWPMSRAALADRHGRGGTPQPGQQRPRLSAGDARRGQPRLPVSRPTPSRRWSSPPSAGRSGHRRRSAPKPGIKVITVPENRWERVDIKTVGLLPNVLAKQKAKASRRPGSLVRRCRRQRQGRRVLQRLDRHQGRRAGHPAGRKRHPARHHAHDAVRRGGQARPEDRGARLYGRRGQGGARSLHHARPRPSSCRSWRSTAIRSPTAIPARSHFPCARPFLTLRKKRRPDNRIASEKSDDISSACRSRRRADALCVLDMAS